MQFSAFKHTLAQVETLEFQLPNGQFVPAYFHLTEVGHVPKLYRLWRYTTTRKETQSTAMDGFGYRSSFKA